MGPGVPALSFQALTLGRSLAVVSYSVGNWFLPRGIVLTAKEVNRRSQ